VTNLEALNALDAKFERVVTEASETFYRDNCREEEPGKFRCPLSGKLFRDETFVRKHIDNKHSDKVTEAKRAALEPKYVQYYSVEAERLAAMPPLPPPPPRFVRDMDDRGRRDRYSDRGGDSFGKGFGKGVGKGFGKGYFAGKGLGGMPYGRGGGRAPPPPEGATLIDRPMVTYRDLDAPDDDDLFS